MAQGAPEPCASGDEYSSPFVPFRLTDSSAQSVAERSTTTDADVVGDALTAALAIAHVHTAATQSADSSPLQQGGGELL